MARMERGSATEIEALMKARTSQTNLKDDVVRRIKLQKFYFYHFIFLLLLLEFLLCALETFLAGIEFFFSHKIHDKKNLFLNIHKLG